VNVGQVLLACLLLAYIDWLRVAATTMATAEKKSPKSRIDRRLIFHELIEYQKLIFIISTAAAAASVSAVIHQAEWKLSCLSFNGWKFLN